MSTSLFGAWNLVRCHSRNFCLVNSTVLICVLSGATNSNRTRAPAAPVARLRHSARDLSAVEMPLIFSTTQDTLERNRCETGTAPSHGDSSRKQIRSPIMITLRPASKRGHRAALAHAAGDLLPNSAFAAVVLFPRNSRFYYRKRHHGERLMRFQNV